jgi:subtilisin family serine protease
MGVSQPPSTLPFAEGTFVTGPDATIEEERVLVRFRTGVSQVHAAQTRRSSGATLARSYHLVPGLELLTVGSGRSALDTVAALSHNPNVQYVTPDVAYHLQATPNDPLYSQQWGLESIRAPAAWNRSTGSASIVVAVLDTGITLNHPDLAANLWTNPVDGSHGWNFVGGNNNPADDYGHGTHVAGIIGAAGNNGVGVAGVNWSVRLMPLKICNAQASCSLDMEISALEYAVAHGAKVANASFGGAYGGYQPEKEAIQAAGNAGLLYVAAAGNNASNNDTTPFYPASYPLENIISVAATTSSDTLASFSDYGANSVQIGAPGQSILSTLPTSDPLSSSTGYGELSGTSMAAPFVTGAAALLWSLHPSWTMQQVRSRLLNTVRPLAALARKASTCGELNLDAATNPEVTEQSVLCVTRLGTGSGSVSSSPAGINCGVTCSASFNPGTQVTLTVSPAAGSTFAGWRGACTGTGSCIVSPTTGADVTAIFRTPGTPAGWTEGPLPPPSAREPFASGSSLEHSFYNVSLSAEGNVRAKTIYNQPSGFCTYATSQTGGVFLERKTPSGWVADGSLNAPAVGTDLGAHWANCFSYGTVTELSGDGSTLLVASQMAFTVNPELGARYRCAAFVYRHGVGVWALDGTLFPPGVEANGSVTREGCDSFGTGGVISDDGTRVAVLSEGRVDVFVRGPSGWSGEQHIVLPEGPGCTHAAGSRQVAFSGDGATLLVGEPSCETSGQAGSGRVYAYTRSGSSWSLAQTIGSPEAQQHNEFGGSIAISDGGSTAAISVGNRITGLPPYAGAAWVYEHDEGGWHARTRLTASIPEENTRFSCPTIVGGGSRIICGASDMVGYASDLGSIYVFERPVGGWTSSGFIAHAFATEGFGSDSLGTGPNQGRAFAASADGSLIDATISPLNVANGDYPNDRIGYEFVAPPFLFPPKVSSIEPSSGTTLGGAQVTIKGSGFVSGATVTIGGAATEVLVVSATVITAKTAAHAEGEDPVVVTDAGGTSSGSVKYTYVVPPTVSSIEPSSGPAAGGTAVTVRGANLSGASAVKFGSAVATGVKVESPSEIAATSPAGSGTVDVTVTTAGGQSAEGSADHFTYIAAPTVTKVEPSSGPEAGGTTVTIKGSGFLKGATVKIGSSATSVEVLSETEIKAKTAAHAAGAQEVVVSDEGGSSTGGPAYTYVAPPTVISIEPTSGTTLGGTSVTIKGKGFLKGSTVTIGSAATSVVVVSATEITATTAAGAAGPDEVIVSDTNGTSSAGPKYTYVAPAMVEGVTPNQGPTAGGTSVKIKGKGFLKGSTVTIGSAASEVKVVTEEEITAKTPAGLGAQEVVVSDEGGSSTGGPAYTYVAPPTVISIEPTSGTTLGGAQVTIKGSGFVSGATVTIGGAATEVVVVTDTEITAKTAAHAEGEDPVVVTDTGGTSSGSVKYTYIAPVLPAPTVQKVETDHGGTEGGTTVTITGTNFENSEGAAKVNAVSFGSTPASGFTVNSDSSISAIAPPGATGAVDVTVTTPSGTSATSSADQFTYTPAPVVSSVSPAYGPVASGTSMTVTGSGFTSATQVYFGSQPAKALTVNSRSSITAVSPAGSDSTGWVHVTVAAGSATSATSNADQFVYAPTITSVLPTSGPVTGGTPVTITGTGFTSDGGMSAILVGGGGQLSSFQVVSDTTITGVMPAEATDERLAVSLVGETNGTAGQAVLPVIFAPQSFTYTPTGSSVSPSSGSPAGGISVTITGTGFTGATQVRFGSTPVIDHIANLRVTPARLIAAASRPSATASSQAKAGKGKRGAMVSYTDTQSATTTFTVQHLVEGRRQGRSCVKPTKHNRSRGRCIRVITIGGFIHADAVGPNRFRFTGRVDGRKLSLGSYRLRAIPRNAAGNGPAVYVPFRVAQ